MIKILKTAVIACSVMISVQNCTAQEVVMNREVVTTGDGKMMLGPQTIDRFSAEPYSDWYLTEMNEYAVDQEAIEQLKKEKIKTFKLTVFVGTWCSDSHREFPRLMKILETVDYPMDKLTVYALNRKKESPTGEEGLYNIHKVPTIIIHKYDKEIGRITEMPASGWIERDLLDIVRKHDSSVKQLFKKEEK